MSNEPDPFDGARPMVVPPAKADKAAPTRDPLAKWTTLATLGRDWLIEKPRELPVLLWTTPEKEKCFLPQGKVGMLVAAGGRGKSQALADLAVAVASGGAWLGTYPVKAPGRVLLAYGEEDLDEAQRRLHRIARAAHLLPDNRGTWANEEAADRFDLLLRNLELLPLYGMPAALVDPGAADVATALAESLIAKLAEPGDPWSLIILDPGARFMGADAETDNAAATLFVEVLERLTESPGEPTVLLAHHMSKANLGNEDSNQGAARGSSALVDGARWVANLDPMPLGSDRDGKAKARAVLRERLGEQKGGAIRFLRLHVTKTNYGPRVDPLELVNWEGSLVPADEETQTAFAAACGGTGSSGGGRGSKGKAKRGAWDV
jgi:hypothetical protein